jgi:hypothetical protein
VSSTPPPSSPTPSSPEPSSPTPARNDPAAPLRTLSLVKGENQYHFRYEQGKETEVLQSLVEMVNRRDVAFDWFDAAVLSHQLGQHLSKELKGYLPKKVA